MSDAPRTAINGLFVLALFYTLVWASDFLIPVVAAVIGSLILSAPRRYLADIGVPPIVTAFGVTILIIVGIGYGTTKLAEPATKFIEEIPELVEDLRSQVGVRGGIVEAAEDAVQATEDIVSGTDEGATDVRVVADSTVATTVLGVAPNLFAMITFALGLMFFLIAAGDDFLRKTVESYGSFRDKRKAIATVHLLEQRLGQYLGSITLINAGLGLAVGLAMWMWDVPNAVSIGVMAMLLNFMPFIGAVLGACIAGLMTFSSAGSLWEVMGVFGTYMALTSLEGQFITPMLLSRRLRLNTTFVFLAVAFFAYIWSIIGMIMAVPILIFTKTICDEVPGLQGIGRFLGDEVARPQHQTT